MTLESIRARVDDIDTQFASLREYRAKLSAVPQHVKEAHLLHDGARLRATPRLPSHAAQ
jgi:hypothetical protein